MIIIKIATKMSSDSSCSVCKTENSAPEEKEDGALSTTCSSDLPPTLNKSEMYDLYKLDRDLRRSTGIGIFNIQVSNILERYFTIGEIDIDKANATLSEMLRGKDEFVGPAFDKST